jgi:hypothetical protein
MKLRTELAPAPLATRINCPDSTLLLGSCFTEHIGQWLRDYGLRSTCNPWGILFNPASIAQNLTNCLADAPREPEICHQGGRCLSYDHHGSIWADDEAALRDLLADIDRRARAAYLAADHILVTFGTAWVFERNGRIVANCHKSPASEFTRRRLTVDEIVGQWSPFAADKHLIFTVSPIRHLADGLHGNQLSKATLLLAIDRLRDLFPTHVEYLPAYELLIDDLRDYRFYADDLVHPAPLAIEAVKELFLADAASPQLRRYMDEMSPLVRTLAHRPSNPDAPEYIALREKTLAEIERIKARTLSPPLPR